jgi:hypothetical protein
MSKLSKCVSRSSERDLFLAMVGGVCPTVRESVPATTPIPSTAVKSLKVFLVWTAQYTTRQAISSLRGVFPYSQGSLLLMFFLNEVFLVPR